MTITNSNNSNAGGIGIFVGLILGAVLAALFAVLKMAHVIAVPWVWALAPLWVPLAILAVGALMAVAVVAVVALVVKD